MFVLSMCKVLSRVRVNNIKKLSPRVLVVSGRRTFGTEKNVSTVEDALMVPAHEPGKIQAAVLKEFSGQLIIENVDAPKITKDQEVIIDVHCCSINASDVLYYQNKHAFKPTLPVILGYEIVGKLTALGPKAQERGYRVGDKVIALNREHYGGWAEQCRADVDDIWKIPPDTKSMDAACLLSNYTTALIGLERKAVIDEDDMIIVNVGNSGNGLAAVDLATNVFRAKVIAICATEDGAAMAREKGAHAALKFKHRNLLKHLADAVGERNVKAVFEGVSAEHFQKVLHCFTDIYKDETSLKGSFRDDNFAVAEQHLPGDGGRVVVAGTAVMTLQAQSVVYNGSFSVTGFDMQEYKKKQLDVYRQAGDEVLQFYEEGLITPTCSSITGLYKINDALQSTIAMKFAGKVAIDMKNKDVMFFSGEDYDSFLLEKGREDWYRGQSSVQ